MPCTLLTLLHKQDVFILQTVASLEQALVIPGKGRVAGMKEHDQSNETRRQEYLELYHRHPDHRDWESYWAASTFLLHSLAAIMPLESDESCRLYR
jgi:hypothetical protein